MGAILASKPLLKPTAINGHRVMKQKENQSGTRNLATYSMLVKSWILEDSLPPVFIKPSEYLQII